MAVNPALLISIVVALTFQSDSKVFILKLVVLVKLAFVAKLNFCHHQQRRGTN